MRAYLVDELSPPEIFALETRLRDMGFASALDNLFWIPVPETLLSPLQREHAGACGPYVLALEIAHDAVRLEWLVRGLGNLHCVCVGFASPDLARHMEDWLNTHIDELVSPPLLTDFGACHD